MIVDLSWNSKSILAQVIFGLCDLHLPIIGTLPATRCQQGTMLKPMASRWGKTIPRFSAANATPGKVMEALRVQGDWRCSIHILGLLWQVKSQCFKHVQTII